MAGKRLPTPMLGPNVERKCCRKEKAEKQKQLLLNGFACSAYRSGTLISVGTQVELVCMVHRLRIRWSSTKDSFIVRRDFLRTSDSDPREQASFLDSSTSDDWSTDCSSISSPRHD